jgi:hypothetical protein
MTLREFVTPEQIKRAPMHSTNKAFERYFRVEKNEILDIYQCAAKAISNKSKNIAF